VPQGWNGWFALLDTGVKYYDYSVNDNGTLNTFGDKPRHYSSDLLARRAVNSLAVAPAQPFFLYLAFDGPHAPPTPAAEDKHRFDDLPLTRLPSFNQQDVSDKPTWVQQLPVLDSVAQQDADDFRRDQIATLQGIDRAVGTVIDSLRADGRLDNTWLVFTSDNGLSLGEHRYTQHKSCGYEDCVRVPLVLVPPPAQAEEFGVPRNDERLVLNIDLAPTLAALQGATADIPIDGINLLPALADPGATWRTDGGLELWAEDSPSGFRGVRSGPWKYLRYDNDEQELYNLHDDPYELHNLAGQPESADQVAAPGARVEVLVPKIP
jgi:arylsulfatase A-like enzyme